MTAGSEAVLSMGRSAAVQSDEALAERVASGDHAAFAALAQRYETPLYNFVLRFLGSPDDAADAAQETLIQVFQALPASRPNFAFRPWLYRVARNKCIDMLRRRRTTPFSAIGSDPDEDTAFEHTIADSDPLPDEVAERADIQRILQTAIDRLPEKYRLVVSLRYAAELTFAEIGESLGLPENTVKTHFQRAKAMLRTSLADSLAAD